MNAVKKVQVDRWEDRFGRLHETELEALRANAYADLMKRLDDYSAYGEMPVDNVARFLDENADVVQMFIATKVAK